MQKTEVQQVAETPKTTKVADSPSTAKRLPVGEKNEKKAVSQVEVDLAISTEASETETANYKDVTVATVPETYSDVEPSSPERMDKQEQQQEPEVKMKPVMVPKILADFTESIVITDEDEPKLIVDMPTVSHGEDTRIVRARSPVSTTSVNWLGFRNFHCTLTDAPLQDLLILCAILLLFWPLLFLLSIPSQFILNTRGDT